MTPRHIALAVAAVAVLGLGVYLYVAVNATSNAVANVRPRSPEAERPSPRTEKPAANPPEPGSAQPRVNVAVRANAVAVTPGETPPSERPIERPGAHIDIKKDELMATANKAYDHGDFDEAIVVAKKVLSNDPGNVRMLRIMVSSSCILDDAATAQKSYLLLPIGGTDRADMKRRCDRYGVTFTD